MDQVADQIHSFLTVKQEFGATKAARGHRFFSYLFCKFWVNRPPQKIACASISNLSTVAKLRHSNPTWKPQ
ncbi:hypothetical protein ROLI_028550 [Roseobacter fucihabitans]|uniref:Uncharacterized protein n=1 Tax=Roseobacter fucihabitans TaxID=1537242 RepID=A0ABZ2BUT1_9RHOB